MLVVPLFSETSDILSFCFSKLATASLLVTDAPVLLEGTDTDGAFADSREGRAYLPLVWALLLPLLFAMAAGLYRWRKFSSAYRTPLSAGFRGVRMDKVETSREERAKQRDRELEDRTESLMEIYRLYTRGEVDEAYRGLKCHLEYHPFELNFYLVCLNMLAETGVRPSAEMIRLVRHALRQLKVHRPRMWLTVAEHGRRVLPDFDRWDERASLSSHRHPHL